MIKDSFINYIKLTSGTKGTFMVTIPKSIIENLKLDVGEKVLINITRAEEVDIICKCNHCGKESISSSSDVYCKHCGSEDLTIISEDSEDILLKSNGDDI
jgi:Zn finger protein HypA/HybF involved in hydrogenase expression